MAAPFCELPLQICLRMDEWKKALDNEDNEELRSLFQYDKRPMKKLAKKLTFGCKVMVVWDEVNMMGWCGGCSDPSKVLVTKLRKSCLLAHKEQKLSPYQHREDSLKCSFPFEASRFGSVHEKADDLVDMDEFRKACQKLVLCQALVGFVVVWRFVRSKYHSQVCIPPHYGVFQVGRSTWLICM